MTTTAALPRAGAPRTTGVVLLALLLLAGAVSVQLARERVAPAPPPLLPTLWMRAPAVLDRLALSFDAVVADAYWIRAVVYYGSVRRSRDLVKNFDLLYPLLDITTSLDPRFMLAYRMGAIFLSEGYPSGPGRPDLAIALLEKGLRQDPSRWQLMHDIGFVHYWWLQDYRTAADWFRRAGEVDGAPGWLKPLMAGTLARGGSRDSARLLWQEMLSSDAEILRDAARLRLAQFGALDDIEALHSLIARVALATGRRPSSWADLIRWGWLRDVPRDPTGIQYEMDPMTARITVSRGSRLFPLPAEGAS